MGVQEEWRVQEACESSGSVVRVKRVYGGFRKSVRVSGSVLGFHKVCGGFRK